MKKPLIVGIYKITSPSGKSYIGQAVDINRRWKDYKCLNCKFQVKLYNSFVKYGVENHTFEIIHICKRDELNELEVYYIKKYNTFNSPFGLNLRIGGDVKKFSDESIKKLSESHKGQKAWNKGLKMSEEQRLAMTGENSPLYGKKWSEERRRNHRNPKKKRTAEHIKNNADANRGKKRSIEIIMKMRESRIGIKLSDEHKRKISESLKGRVGRKHSEETKKKISELQIGRKISKDSISKREETKRINREKRLKDGYVTPKRTMSDEFKKYKSESMIGDKNHFFGKKHNQETLNKISTSNKGRIQSDETRRKRSEAMKGKNVGFRSIEARMKMRKSALGRKMSNETIMKRQATKMAIRQERLTMIF